MPQPLQPDEELNTWQEIAAYLGISKREAQYREEIDGMPVHRLPGKRSRVYARRAELDAWKERVVSTAPTAVSKRPALLSTSAGPTNPDEQMPPREAHQLVSRRAWLGVGAFGFASAGVVSFLLRSRIAPPVHTGVVGNSLVAWDNAGQKLWSHGFASPLREREPVQDRGMVRFPGRHIQTVRAPDGDRVLFVASFLAAFDEPPVEELYCFSSSGKVLWRYRPDVTVRFADGAVAAPWYISDLLVARDGRPKPILLALSHWMKRPGVIVALDWNGRPETRFVSAGQIYALGQASIGGRSHLWAGGVNNEYSAASVAILDEAGPACRSPQTPGGPFEVVGGPTENPERYVLLPPTDLTSAADQPYNFVVFIRHGNAGYEVDTTDIPGERIGAIYRFSDQGEPVDIAFGDGWAARHRGLQKQGRLDHSISACPHLSQPTQIQVWGPTSGWGSLAVRVAAGMRATAFRA